MLQIFIKSRSYRMTCINLPVDKNYTAACNRSVSGPFTRSIQENPENQIAAKGLSGQKSVY